MFIFQNLPRIGVRETDLKVDVAGVYRGTTHFDLSLMLTEEGGDIEYAVDLFDEAPMRRMAQQFLTLLDGILADPTCRISALPLPPDELQLVLKGWNATERSYPHDRCMHQLIEAQVRLAPDAVAVVYGDQQLTYRELDARANQLAHHLRVLGVGPEVLVGICAERAIELIVGLLGILKAGGAYVPLDPSYPTERPATNDQRPTTNDQRPTANDKETAVRSNLQSTICNLQSAGATDNGQRTTDNGQWSISAPTGSRSPGGRRRARMWMSRRTTWPI
jgi:non-ribosomal peptide synthetase component F